MAQMEKRVSFVNNKILTLKKTEENSRYFTTDQLKTLKNNHIPQHVAIIMDGNRRWAKKRNLSSITKAFTGHWAGAKILLDIVGAAKEIGIKVITVYAFSTENWSRSPTEISTIMRILEEYLQQNLPKMIEQGIRFNTIGDLNRFSQEIKELIIKTRQETKDCNQIELVMALNYGGRDDIRRAVAAIADDYAAKKITKEEITEKLIDRYLDTAKWKDPDLLIRTSGEMRLSNFLLWQISYAEVHVTDVYWPDFSPQDFLNAVLDFQKRERRIGL